MPNRIALCQLDVPVAAQNNTITRSDLYVVDEPSISAPPFFFHNRETCNTYKVQGYRTNKTCLQNSSNARIGDEGPEESMEHLHNSGFPALDLFVHGFHHPLLCTLHAHQFDNSSYSEPLRLYQFDVNDVPVAVGQNGELLSKFFHRLCDTQLVFMLTFQDTTFQRTMQIARSKHHRNIVI